MALIRINFNAFESGEQYFSRLSSEANIHFQIFLKLLSSYWQSTIDGPNYTRELKAMSIELARIRLALDDIRQDTSYSSVRSEYLYQVLTSVLFPSELGAPNTDQYDLEFRDFLNEIILLYFQGSIPASIKKAVELITGGTVIVRENFEEAQKPGSGFNISDQFGFVVDVVLESPGDIDVFLADENIRLLLRIIRPAHTLFRIRYILNDEYPGQYDPDNNQLNKMVDDFNWVLSCYDYEDFRKFVLGVEHIDILGTKSSVSVSGESHSMDF